MAAYKVQQSDQVLNDKLRPIGLQQNAAKKRLFCRRLSALALTDTHAPCTIAGYQLTAKFIPRPCS
eukprot:7866040-Pyramimonas_sp.AAC.1